MPGPRSFSQVRLDCLAIALLAVVYLIPFHTLAELRGVPPWAAALLGVVLVLPAAGRRLRPRSALAVVTVASAAVVALSASPAPPLSVAFVIYLLPSLVPRREAWWLLGGSLAVLGAGLAAFAAVPHGAAGPGGGRTALMLLTVSWLLVAGAWLAGDVVRQRRLYAELLREQAARSAREEIAEARRAATATRVEIARELHDVVAHSLSLIAVQAGVANWVTGSQPEQATQALVSIEQISRGALQEMRMLLGVLRADGEEPAPRAAAGRAELAPARGLADLDELAERATVTGLKVSVDVHGTATPLPPGLDLAAYRVVQEAMTNVIKHAGATRCHISVRYAADAVTLEITDDGPGTGGDVPPRASHGITGMRERVAIYGGDFTAGPVRGSGFRVTARFPLPDPAAA
jgi:signal transduction histidine kinase